MKQTGSPLAPIFAAIDDLGGYDFSKLDFVSDRNSLRKLYRWSTGVAEDFRIDVELAGQTCLFTRREEKDSETIVGFRGFGRQYEKAATRAAPGCERATSHHRIITIVSNKVHHPRLNFLIVIKSFIQNFGGLKVLLRFEVDACTGETDADDLASAFSSLGISSTTAATATEIAQPHAIPGVTVIRSNPRTLVAQSSLIELKTRVAHKPLDWADTYPQLYLSQTPHLYLAKHSRGSFTSAEKFNLAGSTLVSYAKQAEEGMGKLKAMLGEVLAEVKEAGSGVGLCLICVGGQLALYKRKEGTGKSVGKEILSRFT
jgi:hypothetical protein